MKEVGEMKKEEQNLIREKVFQNVVYDMEKRRNDFMQRKIDDIKRDENLKKEKNKTMMLLQKRVTNLTN
jgi:hypothetical protein